MKENKKLWELREFFVKNVTEKSIAFLYPFFN